ncbi:F-box domain protein [Dictyocaulus viviparus]|uniref:F-box domain protein n=1 Tax=Dictyocaulus viviparus TaxID=29172 RepID=A0A0D8XU16_DICVI|nr:F-box domain protein [Dictyocaulus viviparus]
MIKKFCCHPNPQKISRYIHRVNNHRPRKEGRHFMPKLQHYPRFLCRIQKFREPQQITDQTMASCSTGKESDENSTADSNCSYEAGQLPAELLFKILEQIDVSTAYNCRFVCNRWRLIIEKLFADNKVLSVFKLSRLIISGLPRKALEFRRVNYDERRSVAMVLPHESLRRRVRLSYSFYRFKIQRLFLKNLRLTDELVDFLRIQLSMCDLSFLTQLSLYGVDFSCSTSETFRRLLELVDQHIETLELYQSTGMKDDSVTDEHLAQLNSKKIRRIMIDGVRFRNPRRFKQLQLGDESLRLFLKNKNFPTLILDRCSVTTKSICDYAENWMSSTIESEKCIRLNNCTLKRCVAVKGQQFEVECRKRGLNCKRRKGGGNLIIYNVQAKHSLTQFIVATQPIEIDENQER